MALNPFEQLQHLVPEPRAAFEEIVAILLKDHGKSDGQVRVCLGDAGVDAYQGSFGEQGELIVYQSKYFPGQWKDPQKQQIRESFRTASESSLFKLKEWYLCVPARPTKEDLRWFDNWSRQKSVKIDLIDGDDLTKMLQAPEDARAREELRKWGVFSVRDGYAVLEFSVFCVARHPRSHLTFSLHILLTNKGDRTAEGLKVVIEHSNTNCVAVSTDSALWDDRGKGVLNPRTVWSKADLHPGDGIRVLEMPLKADTPFPLWIKASAWLRDASPTQQSIVLQESELASNSRRVFNAAG